MDEPKPSPLPKEELQRRVAERSAKVAAEKEAAEMRRIRDEEMDKKMQEASKKFPRKAFAKGGMPDLTGDGKITRADVLKGRGVFKHGGKIKKYAGGGSVSSASKRADGCAVKGKTRGKFV